MRFDDLDIREKKSVWSKLCKLADRYDQISYSQSYAEGKIEELSKVAEDIGTCVFAVVFVFGCFLYFYILLIMGLCENGGFFAELFDRNSVLFVVLCCLFASVAFAIIWLVVAKLMGFSDARQAKKQIEMLKKKIVHCKNDISGVNFEIRELCKEYSIPVAAARLEGLLYVKEQVEKKQVSFGDAFDLFVKNWSKMKYFERYDLSLRAGVREQYVAQKSKENPLFERALSLPFKVGGAFLGVDEEVIRRKRYYGDNNHNSYEENPFVVEHLQENQPSIDSVRTEYIEAYTLHKQTGGPLVLNLNTSGLSKDQVQQAIVEAESYLDSVGYK